MAFNHKRAGFWLPNFGFKRSLLSLLKAFYLQCSNVPVVVVNEVPAKCE